jgi:hypothetical protein
LTIIAAYQVNQQPTNTVGITAWHQQRLQLDDQGRQAIHPRQAFIEDLIQFIKRCQADGHNIILGGDFNETTHKNTSGLLRLLSTTDLLDPWTRRYPNHPDFNTYARGTSRIDGVFCSPNLYPFIEAHGYAPFYWITNSDHRAVVIDFNSDMLFYDKNVQQDGSHMTSVRTIQSNDTQQVIRFVKKFHEHLRQNNAFIRVRNAKTAEDIESIDRLITQASESAEKHKNDERNTFQ